jgi:hypothetical protein
LPAELGGQHPSVGPADPGQLGGGPGPVHEHGDGLGDDPAESAVRVGQGQDVGLLDLDVPVETGGDVAVGAGEHERGQVGGGHVGVEPLGGLDGGGGDPAADVQDVLAGRQPASSSSCWVERRLPGWMTRLPSTARNA